MLRTIDIGEADRLCILFTREAGRKAAKATSVRKTGSRLGGTLLPFRHVTVELSEGDHHVTITGAVHRSELPDPFATFASFVRLEQGIELLLMLTEDDEPMPRVFDLLLQFIHLAGDEEHRPLVPFQIRLLHLLGFLPEDETDYRFQSLSEAARVYVQACIRISDLRQLCDLMPDHAEIEKFAKLVMGEQLVRPLKSMA